MARIAFNWFSYGKWFGMVTKLIWPGGFAGIS